MIPFAIAGKFVGGFIANHWRTFVAVGLVLAVLAFCYVTGRKHERQAWEGKQHAAAMAGAKETQRLIEKNYVITTAVAEVIERERVVTQEIVRKVPIYVPADACPVDPGVRVVHDAAAAGEDPAPGARADAAPVEARTLAETIATNYGRCRSDQARLVKLQQYVRDICRPEGLEPEGE